MTSSPPSESASGGFRIAGVAILIAGAAAVYAPAMHGHWIWDDSREIVTNPLLRDPAGWWKAWTRPAGVDYLPLKTMLQWFEFRLWGTHRVFGYHAVNLALHVISSLLLWRVLRQLGTRWGWLGGLLFAIHPLAVESIAWVAEFKNALSLPLLLLALSAWLEERPARSLLWFALSLLAKPSGVLFPIFLLILAWWRRGAIVSRDWKRVAPFFAVSLALGLVTAKIQGAHDLAGAGGPLLEPGWAGAGRNLFDYIWDSICPDQLAPVYAPYIHPAWGWLVWAGVAGATLVFWIERESWGRHAMLAEAWFVLNLIPVLGLMPMAYLHVAPRADHLAYVSLAGFCGTVAALFGAIWDRVWSRPLPVRGLLAGAAALAMASLLATGRAYAGAFFDEPSLWTVSVQRQPSAWVARSNLGRTCLAEGDLVGAELNLRAAAELRPDSAEIHDKLGEALQREGHSDEAVTEFRMAALLAPDFADAHYDLAEALLDRGDLDGAVRELRTVLKLDPGHAAAHNRLGLALMKQGDRKAAVDEYRTALRFSPDLAEAHLNLGNAALQGGDADGAAAEYRAALAGRPDYAAAHENLARALLVLGRQRDAQAEFRAAQLLGR